MLPEELLTNLTTFNSLSIHQCLELILADIHITENISDLKLILEPLNIQQSGHWKFKFLEVIAPIIINKDILNTISNKLLYITIYGKKGELFSNSYKDKILVIRDIEIEEFTDLKNYQSKLFYTYNFQELKNEIIIQQLKKEYDHRQINIEEAHHNSASNKFQNKGELDIKEIGIVGSAINSITQTLEMGSPHLLPFDKYPLEISQMMSQQPSKRPPKNKK